MACWVILMPTCCCTPSPTRCWARRAWATSARISQTPTTEAARRVAAGGWRIGNVDSTVIAQAPRLAPHIGAMRARIADALGVAQTQVNVKAKTAERLGPVGQGASMEARAVVLLVR